MRLMGSWPCQKGVKRATSGYAKTPSALALPSRAYQETAPFATVGSGVRGAVGKRTELVTGAARRTFNVETVRRLLRKAGYVYLSAKWWITSDDPHYRHKKARRDAILAWARRDPSIRVVFQDESWFSGTPK